MNCASHVVLVADWGTPLLILAITKEDLEFSVGSKASVWEVKDPLLPVGLPCLHFHPLTPIDLDHNPPTSPTPILSKKTPNPPTEAAAVPSSAAWAATNTTATRTTVEGTTRRAVSVEEGMGRGMVPRLGTLGEVEGLERAEWTLLDMIHAYSTISICIILRFE